MQHNYNLRCIDMNGVIENIEDKYFFKQLISKGVYFLNKHS